MIKKTELFLLTLFLLGGFIVRLYGFSNPIADWQSWRQADTSSVSRNFIKFGFDILHPRFDDLSNGVSLIDNPQGYRFVEFPIYNLLQAGAYSLFGHFTIEQWGRLVTIFSSLTSVIFIYLLVKKYISIKAAFAGAFFYAFIPYDIFYGRVVLPDTTMVAFLLGGIFFFDRWLEEISNLKSQISKPQRKSKIFFVMSIFFTALAFLLKPFALFFTLPMLYLAWNRFGLSLVKKWQLWLFVVLTLTPLIFWRLWMNQYPEGIPRNDWLFNGNGIRFKGAFFHWIFAERISNFILGYFGLPFVIIGLFSKIKKEGFLFYAFLISSLVYLTELATGNVQHDYYQILIIPTLALFFAKGVDFILENAGGLFNRYATYLIVLVSILFMLSFSWFRIRDYYSIQHPEIVETGIAVDRILPKDAKVVAPYNGDTAFLYQTNRQGWPVVERSFKEFIKAGARYIVFAYPTKEELHLGTEFATVAKTDIYAIFDLTKPLKPVK